MPTTSERSKLVFKRRARHYARRPRGLCARRTIVVPRRRVARRRTKLRAKKASRVVDLLLADDCVSPALAAKVAGLFDRAARRVFDRLMALGAVRELSGRPNFRLYGL